MELMHNPTTSIEVCNRVDTTTTTKFEHSWHVQRYCIIRVANSPLVHDIGYL